MGGLCSKEPRAGGPKTTAVRTRQEDGSRRRRAASVKVRRGSGAAVPLGEGVDSAGKTKEQRLEAAAAAADAADRGDAVPDAADDAGTPTYDNLTIPLEFEDVDTYFDEYQEVSTETNDGVGERDEDLAEVVASEKRMGSTFIRWPTQRAGREDASKNKERRQILAEAARLGKALTEEQKARRILCIYNPVSGAGAAKRLVQHMVEPVLKLTGLNYKIMETQYRNHAVEFVSSLDVNAYDGIVIAGGDGLVHEVITGYFRHPDQEGIRRIAIGITPSGTANAMAHELHTHPSNTHVSLVGRAALAVCKGITRKVDVIAVEQPEETIYALSCFGWGLAGAVALKADKLRWIPGQKRARYDIAGAVTMLRDWPIVDVGKLEYPKEVKGKGGKITTEWVTTEVSCVNLIAANLPFLGSDHPIHPNIAPDDGHIAIVECTSKCSRLDVVKLAANMKKGKYLSENRKKTRSYRVKEFKLTPSSAKSPFNIDGDPHEHCPVHVKVMHKALTVFVLPFKGDETAKSEVVNAPMAVAMGVAGVSSSKLSNAAPQAAAQVPNDGGAVSALAMGLLGGMGIHAEAAAPKQKKSRFHKKKKQEKGTELAAAVGAEETERPAEAAEAEAEKPTEAEAEKPAEAEAGKPAEAEADKPPEAELEKPTEAEADKPPEAEPEKPVEAEAEKPAEAAEAAEAEAETPAEAAEAEAETPAEAEAEDLTKAEGEKPAEPAEPAEAEPAELAKPRVSML